jgi:hypothetical protein
MFTGCPDYAGSACIKDFRDFVHSDLSVCSVGIGKPQPADECEAEADKPTIAKLDGPNCPIYYPSWANSALDRVLIEVIERMMGWERRFSSSQRSTDRKR